MIEIGDAGPELKDMNVFVLSLNGRKLLIEFPEDFTSFFGCFERQTGQGDDIGQRGHIGPVAVKTPSHIRNTAFDRIPDVRPLDQGLGIKDIYLHPAFGRLFNLLAPMASWRAPAPNPFPNSGRPESV